jgi:hypothetical protein
MIQTILIVTLIAVLPFVSAKEAFAATNDKISEFAQQFLGAPYLWGGTTPAGFDCSGYIRHVYTKFGIDLPRTSEDQFKVGKAIAQKDLQAGDLVFFENTYKEGISHTGIYLGDNLFISAETKGVTISNLVTNPYWGPKYAGAKRVTAGANGPVSGSTVKPIVPVNKFTDLKESHPAYKAILDLTSKGVINGYLDATFKPEESITRGQVAAMLNRVLKLPVKEAVHFTDVGKDNKFAADITAMSNAGILQGYETGAFGINEQLTRVQLAVIVDRAFNMKAKASQKVQIASLYQDVPTSYWASESIHALKVLDQTTVFQTPAYEITKEVSRAEFSAAVFSAINSR